MTVGVFVSYPRPFTDQQTSLADAIFSQLRDHGLDPRTLGVTEYDNDAPLAAVRRVMMESCGVIVLGLRRYQVESGSSKPGHVEARSIGGGWFSSAWPHMEAAMGYQLGLPLMVLRETGVLSDGIFDAAVTGRYVIEVDSTRGPQFLASSQWKQPLAHWERDVRTVAKNRGLPPKLY